MDLPALRKTHQPVDDPRGAPSLRVDPFELPECDGIGRALARGGREKGNRREGRIQLMGNETRHLAHRGEPFCVQETFLGALAVDGHSDLLRHEVEYALVLLVEAYAFRIALDHDHACRLALTHERDAEPLDGRRSNRNDLSISNEVR